MCRSKADPESAFVFLQEATVYGDEKLIDIVTKFCGRYLIEADALQALPPALFRRVFRHCEPCTTGKLSDVVAKYLATFGGDDENRDTAQVLTGQDKLAVITPKAAVILLKVALRFDLPEVQARSVETISSNWQGLIMDQHCQLFQGHLIPNMHNPSKKRQRDGSPGNQVAPPIPESVQIQILYHALRNAQAQLSRYQSWFSKTAKTKLEDETN